MELVGFKVDRVYITRFLSRKKEKEVPQIRKSIEGFFVNKTQYLKEQAVKNYYKESKVPIERFEYQLAEKIGPSKIKENIVMAQETSKPSGNDFSIFLESDVFNSEIIGDVSLFPTPLNKF